MIEDVRQATRKEVWHVQNEKGDATVRVRQSEMRKKAGGGDG
jgi:hypothetical protein